MSDGVLAWAKRQRAHYFSLLPMLESRKIGTHEMRDGVRVDTTEESIAQTRGWLAEVEALIAKHEA